MKYYGYVFPGFQGVTTDFSVIEYWATVLPYPKWHVFYDKEKATEYVKRNSDSLNILECNLTNYGSVFNRHVKVEYFIEENDIYYNIHTKGIGYINIECSDKNVSIDKRAEIIMLRFTNIQLDKRKNIDNAIAIYYILNFLGDFVDINLVIPARSIMLMINAYTGHNSILLKLQNQVKNRLGELSFTYINKFNAPRERRK